MDEKQRQTAEGFGFQWKRTEAYNSPGMRRHALGWLLERYGFGSAAEMRAQFETAGRMLDLGCGGGYTASLWMDRWEGERYVGVDISDAIEVARQRLGHFARTEFVRADLMDLPFPPASFDLVFSEGVLHHTPSTQGALVAAVSLLRPGGEIMFYVYARKSPIREFADDHIRARISSLPAEEAWDELRSLTSLGHALANLHATVTLPSGVPLLGIQPGDHDVQRLVYWHLVKLFWNEGYTFEENVHINFDWYRPLYCHRQTEDEVRAWCADLGLSIDRFHVDPAGFTVRARLTQAFS